MNELNNPFKQNNITYCLELQIKFEVLHPFVEICETLSNSIVYFEAEDTKTIESKPEDLWQINVYLDKKLDLNVLNNKFATIASRCNVDVPILKLLQIEDFDWVSKVQETFIPINVGKFFIHCSGLKDSLDKDLLNIEINAGRAFGTGEHETTSNCLRALSELDVSINRALDMGCGSGILAIAMAKLGADEVVAVDLDEQSVLVTKENIKINNVASIKVFQSEGYSSKELIKSAPYQVITSNILAAPLVAMAHDASKFLDKKGLLILAGFLNNQKHEVLFAHQAQGLVLLKEICNGEWPVLIMQKN